MRQIFRSIPYFLPADPDWVRELFLEHGRAVRFAAGETLKWGGEARRLFFLTSGLCAYDGIAPGDSLRHRPGARHGRPHGKHQQPLQHPHDGAR